MPYVHTLQLYSASGFIPTLVTTVECRHWIAINVTPVCHIKVAGNCCYAVSFAIQIIWSDSEIEIINHLTTAKGCAPFHCEAYTTSKANTMEIRSWRRAWREENYWHLYIQVPNPKSQKQFLNKNKHRYGLIELSTTNQTRWEWHYNPFLHLVLSATWFSQLLRKCRQERGQEDGGMQCLYFIRACEWQYAWKPAYLIIYSSTCGFRTRLTQTALSLTWL